MTMDTMIKKGFTLIELLIVVSIISILATLLMASFSLARKQGRDTQRRSDIGQYRIALENYYAVNSFYPNQQKGNGNSQNGQGIFLAGPNNPLYSFMNNTVLADPVNSGNYAYYYVGDNSGLNYKLYTGMESGGYWEICSNGKAGATQQQPASDDSVCEIP